MITTFPYPQKAIFAMSVTEAGKGLQKEGEQSKHLKTQAQGHIFIKIYIWKYMERSAVQGRGHYGAVG